MRKTRQSLLYGTCSCYRLELLRPHSTNTIHWHPTRPFCSSMTRTPLGPCSPCRNVANSSLGFQASTVAKLASGAAVLPTSQLMSLMLAARNNVDALGLAPFLCECDQSGLKRRVTPEILVQSNMERISSSTGTVLAWRNP